jgi:hypothetical protein
LEELLVKRDKTSPLLIQTNQDLSNHFGDYMRTGAHPPAEQAATAADRNLLEAIEECESFVQSWKSGGSAALVDLVDILRNRLTLILHEIEDEGLVYTVFEVLNSRGLDVTWFDKLKSLLMAIVFKSGGRNKATTIEELHRIWRERYIEQLAAGKFSIKRRYALRERSEAPPALIDRSMKKARFAS